MNQKTKRYLQHPVMGKVVELNQYLMKVRTLPAKDIQHVYVGSILSLADILFKQALRELRGKDYLRRAAET